MRSCRAWNWNLAKCAGIALGALCQALVGGIPPALAGSIQPPGLTTGLPEGAAPEPGLYSASLLNFGTFSTAAGRVKTGIFIPAFLTWSTPLEIADGRVMIKAVPLVEAYASMPGLNRTGLYSSYVGVWTSWFLGHGFNFALGEGVWIGSGSRLSRDLGVDFTAFQQNLALSYVRDNLNFTANAFYTTGNEDIFVSKPATFNLDLTATKKFGRAEYGLVAFGQWDLNRPSIGYEHRQEQIAVGGLFGYLLGDEVAAQVKVTRTVYEENIGGHDIRVWAQLIVPLWTPPAPVPYNSPLQHN